MKLIRKISRSFAFDAFFSLTWGLCLTVMENEAVDSGNPPLIQAPTLWPVSVFVSSYTAWNPSKLSAIS